MRCLPSLRKKSIVRCELVSCVEVGPNTSTVSLRVIGGDEKRTQCPGVQLDHLFLGDINTGSWASGWASLESETGIYGHESRGTRTWEWLRWRGPAAIVNDTRILSSERMLHEVYNRKCSLGKKLLVVSPNGFVAKTKWLAANLQSWSNFDLCGLVRQLEAS
jgi:hypothetical protein